MKKIASPTWVILDFVEQGGASRIIQDFTRRNKNSFKFIFLLSGTIKGFGQEVLNEFKHSINFSVNFYRSNLKTFFLIAFNTFIKSFKISYKNFKRPPVFVLNMPFSGLGILCNPKFFYFKKIYIFHGALDKELLSKHSCFSTSFTLSKWNNFKLHFTSKIVYLVQKFVMKNSDKILVFSNYSYNLVEKYFLINKDKIFLTKIPLDDIFLKDQIINSNHKKMIRDKYLPAKIKRSFLIYVPSRIEPRKGIHVALESIVKLLEKFDRTSASLKFVFSGPVLYPNYFLHLLLFCKKHNLFSVVEFINTLNREDVYKLYQSADLILMPSLDLETLGMITLESLTVGTPVMGFKLGGTEEILANFLYSDLFLIKKIKASYLASGILKYISLDDNQRKEIKIETKKIAEEYIFQPQNRISLLESIAEISSESNQPVASTPSL